MKGHAENVDSLSPRRRRWFRFSLRTLFIAITLLSLWFGLVYRRVENERRAAEAIRDAHGTIVYDWQVRPEHSDPNFKPVPPGPSWLREHFGAHWFDEIVEVQLNEYANSVSKNRFSIVGPHLVKLRGLRSLMLWSRKFDRDYYALLGQMPQLEKLHLHQERKIDKQDFTLLAGAEGIHELRLDGAKISPEVLKELTKLRHLEVLDIDCFSFDPQTGKILTEYQLRDEAAEILATMPKLRSLMLYRTRTQITDEGMAALSRLSRLETLTVYSPNITSKSLDHVVKLKHLKRLSVWMGMIEDAHLGKLSQLPNLKSLELSNHLSDACVPYLAKLEQLEKLTPRGEEITDESMHHLTRLINLEWLNLRDTSVDKLGTAAKELQQALPKCLILLPKTEKEKARERRFSGWKMGDRGSIVTPEQLQVLADDVEASE